MTAMGGKLGVDPWIGQSVCCGLGWEPVTQILINLKYEFKILRGHKKYTI
jgi:hypothetical protein